MNQIKERYKRFYSDKTSFLSFAGSIVYLIISLIINFFATQYAFVSQSNPVTDILLDNLPVVHVEGAFIWGTIVFLVFIAALLLYDPEKIAFVVKSIALFVVARSLFISLTHIGPSPLNTLSAPSDIGRAFSSGADLFFSGHTGMPYLFALMFWYNRNLRWIFMGASLLAAVGVLLGHIHYSIDVASAFFITYGIFIIAMGIFKKDYERFKFSLK